MKYGVKEDSIRYPGRRETTGKARSSVKKREVLIRKCRWETKVGRVIGETKTKGHRGRVLNVSRGGDGGEKGTWA